MVSGSKNQYPEGRGILYVQQTAPLAVVSKYIENPMSRGLVGILYEVIIIN